ncbi:MAG TPA: hypothetical protein VF587_11745 [Solirubrobacteraceae bacterium]|jgi:hypothetical protein
MSEPQGEPQAADVRSFLPRPGEPVDDYAARLRALHHDLTLVLDAVERGLAAAERAPLREAVAEPAPVTAIHAESHPEPHRSPPPLGPLTAPRGSARVEVVTTGPAHASSGPPGGSASWGGRTTPEGERAPDGGVPAALSPERSEGSWEERPWPAEREPWVEAPRHEPRRGDWVDERDGWGDHDPRDLPPWREPPAWTDRRPSSWPAPPAPPREMVFDPPYPRQRRRRARDLPPVLVAAALLGWLTVLALILALALD